MSLRHVTIAATVLPLVACAQTPNSTHATGPDRIGWMQGNCLAIKSAHIPAAQGITIVRLTTDGNVATHGTVTATPATTDTCPGLAHDRGDVNRADGYHFYTVATRTPVDMAIAYLPNPQADHWHFEACATIEGIRFTVHDARSLIWTGYAYLGYDMQPTCPGMRQP